MSNKSAPGQWPSPDRGEHFLTPEEQHPYPPYPYAPPEPEDRQSLYGPLPPPAAPPSRSYYQGSYDVEAPRSNKLACVIFAIAAIMFVVPIVVFILSMIMFATF